ncbi:MAG: hypothetical protein IT353_23755 [Gemmatimonadaceae bacterium]|nr:hypothetical protein [Gemmatimonadaceae bacterium]
MGRPQAVVGERDGEVRVHVRVVQTDVGPGGLYEAERLFILRKDRDTWLIESRELVAGVGPVP